MPDTVTVTGVVGPAITNTAVVISNVTEILIDTINSVLFITGTIGNTMPRKFEFDIQSQNTVTVTKSGLTWTVTVA